MPAYRALPGFPHRHKPCRTQHSLQPSWITGLGPLPATAVPLGSSLTVAMPAAHCYKVQEEQMELPLSNTRWLFLFPCQACADSHVPPILLPTGHLL